MKTIKTLSIIEIILIALTMLCAFGGAESITTGLWAFATLGVAMALSIVGLVQAGKK